MINTLKNHKNYKMVFPLFDEEVFILCEDQGKGRSLLYCFLTMSSVMSGLVFLNLH